MDGMSDGPDGPSLAELAAIEDEWPVIAAEVELTGAEIALVTAYPHPTELQWRRVRRAERRVERETVEWLARLGRKHHGADDVHQAASATPTRAA